MRKIFFTVMALFFSSHLFAHTPTDATYDDILHKWRGMTTLGNAYMNFDRSPNGTVMYTLTFSDTSIPPSNNLEVTCGISEFKDYIEAIFQYYSDVTYVKMFNKNQIVVNGETNGTSFTGTFNLKS